MLEIVSCHSTCLFNNVDGTTSNDDVITIRKRTTTANTRWSFRRNKQGCQLVFWLHTVSTMVYMLLIVIDIFKISILSDAYSTNKHSSTSHRIFRNNIIVRRHKKSFIISRKKNQYRNRCIHLYYVQPFFYSFNDDKNNIDGNQVMDDDDKAFLSTTTTKTVLESQKQPQKSTPSRLINFVRWNTNTSCNKFEIQTAVISLIHPITNSIIELHSQIHYGEEEYYQYYNHNKIHPHHQSNNSSRSNNNCTNNLYSENDNNNKDFDVTVLYELLIDDTLVSVNKDGQCVIRKYQQTQQYRTTDQRVIVQASINDQQIANQYGLVCQVDGIKYYDNSILGSSRSGSNSNDNEHIKWIHADWTRQELASYRQQIQQQQQNAPLTSASSTLMSIFSEWIQQQQKQLESLIPFTDTANEATAALLLGPPIVMIQQQQQQQQRRNRSERRLFTNMFVSGDSFAIIIRWILWLTIPCPELSILLFDSSSIWFEPTFGRYESSAPSQSTDRILSATLSPIVLPAIQAFAQGNVVNVRKLLFGQVIVDANSIVRTSSNKDNTSNSNDPKGFDDDYDDLGENNNSYNNNEWDIIVTQRNRKCLQVLSNEILKNNSQLTKKRKFIILYGSIHCPDLYNRLLSDGYITTNVRWRTAWSVPVYLPTSTPITSTSSSSSTARSSQSDTKNMATNTKTILPLFVGTVLLVLYLGIGALDWIGIIHDVVIDAEAGTISNVVTDVVLYLLRHTLLYVVLSRYVLDWKKVYQHEIRSNNIYKTH